MARVMRSDDGSIFEVYSTRTGAAYEEFLIYDNPHWTWVPSYMFSEIKDEHARIIFVPAPDSEENAELPSTGLPQCAYLWPSLLYPTGDPRRPCERAGVWALWRENTHSAAVVVACTKHVGCLLAARGTPGKYHVWSLGKGGTV